MHSQNMLAGKVLRVLPLVGLLVASAVPLGLSALRPSPLSLEDRVSAQAALDKALYERRIWPAENGARKPLFEEVVPRTVIEAKVRDYLIKSQALEKYWKRGITPDQLQAELDRMARQTMDPKGLKALFEAVGDDPFLAAECIARPALVERLLRKWYAWDERFHERARAAARDRQFARRQFAAGGGQSPRTTHVYRKARSGALATRLEVTDGGGVDRPARDRNSNRSCQILRRRQMAFA